ncbi:glutathione S-transferase family protein [Emcibacter nanhaiensis]|uniref:Glutathione S-transferase family protein n=1 Tax=Emcibacter nanhaiensis TaxID=1505037 RepID=A0A501PBU7_9PROT|nr:glutathione S-transferase family protein [Emcibacter nanhaiensis]TPD57879.1 glutathione S-transferase family protein [Emcibacter nanhaiensis]
MTMKLYHGEPNGPSLSVLAALSEKNLDADLVYIDLAMAERHGDKCEQSVEVNMSVEGEGPVLVVNGEPLADSVFIARYFDDIGSGTALVPEDSYGCWEVMTWCRQIIERLAPAAAYLGVRAYLQEPLAGLEEGDFEARVGKIASEDLAQRWRDVRAGNFSDEQVEDSQSKVVAAVEKVEGRLDGRDWLMGDFSMADLETYSWLAGMVELVPSAFENAEQTRAWMERVRNRSSVQQALSRATVAEPEKSWAPGPEINRWG